MSQNNILEFMIVKNQETCQHNLLLRNLPPGVPLELPRFSNALPLPKPREGQVRGKSIVKLFLSLRPGFVESLDLQFWTRIRDSWQVISWVHEPPPDNGQGSAASPSPQAKGEGRGGKSIVKLFLSLQPGKSVSSHCFVKSTPFFGYINELAWFLLVLCRIDYRLFVSRNGKVEDRQIDSEFLGH